MSLVMQKTSNYALFKISNKNRDISLSKVDDIKASLKEIGSRLRTHPIVVDENYEIIDGQHRFLAHKELGLPIIFVKDDEAKIDDIVHLNHPQTRWTVTDYVKHHVALRLPAYMYLQTLKDQYKMISYSCLCRVMNVFITGSELKNKVFTEQFRKGKFTFEESLKPELEEFLSITYPALKEVSRLRSGNCGFLFSSTYMDTLAEKFINDKEVYQKMIEKLPGNYDRLIGFTSEKPLKEVLDRIVSSRPRKIRENYE